MRSIAGALLCAAGASAGHLHVLTQDDGTIRTRTIDPATGELGSATVVKMPATKCSPGWVVADGTHGQTSAVFYTNSSMFFIAQEMCGDTAQNTTLFQHRGYVVANLNAIAAADPDGATQAPKHFHLEWDWTCNLILTARAKDPSGSSRCGYTYKQFEISEYDGEIRPQPDYKTKQDQCCSDCWRQVDGAGGLRVDFGYGATRRAGRPLELRCEDCQTYVIEEYYAGFEKTENRRIIGRGVHNGSVVVNNTENTRLVTMSFLPQSYSTKFGGFFLGLGVCCDLDGCPQECEGHGGELAIVQVGSFGPQVLATLTGTQISADATRLGVAIDLRYPATPSEQGVRITVFDGEKMQSFQITATKYDVTAKQLSQSSKLSLANAKAWGYLSF